MRYIHYFETTSAFTEAYNNEYVEPWVSYTEENQQVNYNRDYSKEHFTIEALESGTIQWNISGNTIEYSLNDGDWTEMDSGTTLTASSGDIFRFRGDNNNYGSNGTSPTINASFSFNVYGNIMSLIDSTEFENLTTIPTVSCFACLFGSMMGVGCKVVDASNLILPATTLTSNCYGYMFYGCTSLTIVSALPAKTLANGCYDRMFAGCTSLTTAPALPATTLANGCYQYMFNGCTSLTTAPELPATTMAVACYQGMFADCTSLTTAPELPATTLADLCYGGYDNSGPQKRKGMFQNCTSLTTAPALPATTLAAGCYHLMFKGCINLTTAPELPATTLASSCYRGMFEGCTSLTNAPELPAATIKNISYEKMFSGCTNLVYIKCLAEQVNYGIPQFGINEYYTKNWVDGVSASGIFVKKSTTTDWPTNVDGIPSGWTVQDAS